MTKFKNKTNKEKFDINENLQSIDIEDINIEDIDKDMNYFYIDKEKFDNIKVPKDMKLLVKEAIDKAEKDMKKEKKGKGKLSVAASIVIILSVGIYNPVLAHKMPRVEKLLNGVNNILKIDEIASITGINKIIPKASLDENGKIQFKKASKYNIEKSLQWTQSQNESIKNEGEDEEEKYIEVYEEDVYTPIDENETKNLIHEMANGLIHAIDNRENGYTEVTPKTIDIAIDSLKNLYNEEDREYLALLLEDWKIGDFDNAVEVHNYVWNMLNGEVGEAGSLDYEEIEKIKNNHFR
ncbi:MAG: DUF6241 domain-containing protein [Romboutsia sp.]|uniref:DUF6241 domain-containing protein n=1 Tax=Romboutsia sp. TaxID=1965302 RepID=UPI003F3232BC